MKKRLLALIGSALIAGCVASGPEVEVEYPIQYVSADKETVKEVPGIEYAVQSGDSLGLLTKYDNTSEFWANYPYQGDLRMRGDYTGTKHDVVYNFSIEDFLREANSNYNPERGLLKGQKLIVPDFNRNGCIATSENNIYCGEKLGTFIVTGSRLETTTCRSEFDCSYENKVTKKIEFKQGE